MAKISVMSNFDFDNMCDYNKWNDTNVELLKDKAFISIVGCKECLDLLDIKEREHWFKQNHPNVLNLNFDDIPQTHFYKGAWILAMDNEQAKETVEFIKNNIGKDFYIHCLAGISRSGAVCRWIASNFEEYKDCEKDNPQIRPNYGVIEKLNQYFYSNEQEK